MFDLVKQKVDIEQVMSAEKNLALIKVGESNVEFEDKTCPFCGHRDCFRIKINGEDSFYHCFSCEEHGDVISFVAKSRGISDKDAAIALAKQYNIDIPSNYSPVQEIFTLAAKYYHQAYLNETKVFAELSGKTPKEYQETVRKHKPETLKAFMIGWSDGDLNKYLGGLGFEYELLEQTGLIGKKGGDFLPAKAFIYPHFVNGKVSHFTFKDPLKVKEYQLKNSNKLNGHVVYNQDDAKKDIVAVVEGENDLLSLVENGWVGGVIASIGQLSSSQLSWMEEALKNKKVFTFFDSDAAGDKYRSKVSSIKLHFSSLTQIKLTNGVKDIDEYLTSGGNLSSAIKQDARVVDSKLSDSGTEDDEADGASGDQFDIIERDGCYYKIKYGKDGNSNFVRLTDFIVELRNVFEKNDNRNREVVIVRNDGIRSKPIIIDSESKISVRAFRIAAANAVDASFYGSEQDLIELWAYIYATNKNKERTVVIPNHIGRLNTHGGGWLFRNMFISGTGEVIEPDSEGIIWLGNTGQGLKADPIDVGEDGKFGIPALNGSLNAEQRKETLRFFLTQLARNLGSEALAVTLTAWAKANVYSDELFEAVQGFPFLFIWGKHGQGKTVIGKWVAALFGMDDPGYMTVSQYKTGVGWARKQAYYSSLPLMMDELRADKAMERLYSEARSWYQRGSRPLGTKEGNNIKIQKVRSNVIFLGQDEFIDSATKQRTVTTRIPINNREKDETYKALMSRKDELSAIGFDWILESTRINHSKLIADWKELDRKLVQNGCESRSAKNWAVVGYFGLALAQEFFPNLDYEEYLLGISRIDSQAQMQDDTIYRFFTTLEGLMVQDRAGINAEHLKREGNKLYIWFREVFRIVNNSQKVGSGAEEHFSESAVRNSIADELWHVKGVDREPMGVSGTRRRVVCINLDLAPDTIQNIANTL